MNIFQQFMFGNRLTKLTNIFEQLEATRNSMPIGAGGGIDSLPTRDQAQVTEYIEKSLNSLSKHPRHVVTRELLKNTHISLQFGRLDRLRAQNRLLQVLVDNGVALNIADFEKSYF